MSTNGLTFGGLLLWLRFCEEAPALIERLTESSDEKIAAGDPAAALEILERVGELQDEHFAAICTMAKLPEHDVLSTVCRAAGCEVNRESLKRLAASAAVKRGLTLGALTDLPAAEVLAWMAEVDGGESVELTKKQLGTILDCSEDTVSRRVTSGVIKVKKTVTSKRLEVFVDCLPADWKERLSAATGKK